MGSTRRTCEPAATPPRRSPRSWPPWWRRSSTRLERVPRSCTEGQNWAMGDQDQELPEDPGRSTPEPDSEKSTEELDDVADRHELRDRYSMLLGEVRVSLPGVQLLSAFLLTAPFSNRFGDLD